MSSTRDQLSEAFSLTNIGQERSLLTTFAAELVSTVGEVFGIIETYSMWEVYGCSAGNGSTTSLSLL